MAQPGTGCWVRWLRRGDAPWCTATSRATGLSPLPTSNCHLATKAFATLFSSGPLASSLPPARWQARGLPGTPLHAVPSAGTLLKAFYERMCLLRGDSGRRQGRGLRCDVLQEQFS